MSREEEQPDGVLASAAQAAVGSEVQVADEAVLEGAALVEVAEAPGTGSVPVQEQRGDGGDAD
jgi:hypothetical protein